MLLYNFIRGLGAYVGSLVLLVMRLYWGYLFFTMGLAKFGDMDNMVSMFEGLGIMYPAIMVQLVAYVEVIGGLCLMFGFAARVVTIPLIIIMITAYMTAHYDALINVFSDPQAFMNEKPFMFLLTCLFTFSCGAGYVSIDHYLKTRMRKSSEEEE